MKYLLFIVLLVAVVIAAGCMSSNQNIPVTSTQTPSTTSIPTSTTVFPLSTTNIPIESMTSVQPTIQITSDDIRQHFMDTAFGAGSNFLNKLSDWYLYQGPENPPQKIKVIYRKPSYIQDSDGIVIQNFASEWNNYSKTLKLKGYEGDLSAPFSIIVVSQSDFINLIKSPSIVEHNGVIYSKGELGGYGTDIYISKDLQGDGRNYTIIMSLLRGLGFRGETLKYKDSIFYTENYNNPNLSYIDKKAIEIMYGPGLTRGMTVEDVKNIVNPGQTTSKQSIPIQTIPTLRPQTGPICNIVSNQGYRYGSMWTVYGYASNTGTTSGTCIVLVELIASNGGSLNSQSLPVFISSGGVESFSITVNAPDNAGRYKISISDKKLV